LTACGARANRIRAAAIGMIDRNNMCPPENCERN
jgi:hypothetical protein